MKELMRPDTPDDYGYKSLQNIILNIAYDLDLFCQKNDIRYRLMGGSALGAKRHGGFIPWDDDLDVFMTPTEYEKFRDAFHKYGDTEKYYLQERGASKGKVVTAKVRLNKSFYDEEIVRSWMIHKGIFIDIFILHTCPDNMLQRRWQYFWAKYVVLKGLANKEYHRHGNLTYYFLKAFGYFPKRFLLNYALNQVYAYRNKQTSYYCNYLGKALMKNGTYKREYFENIKRAPFETIELNVAEKLEEFLTERFGDYMKPPSKERIKYEQHSTNWDLGNYDYTDKSDEPYYI